MNHVLSVGEIYDKALDLCVRNAGKIALTFGAYSLLSDTLDTLFSGNQNYELLGALHLRPHAVVTPYVWSTWFGYVSAFLLLPIAIAALFKVFDCALHGDQMGILRYFRSSFRRIANVVVGAFLTQVYVGAPGSAIVLGYLRVVVYLKQPAVTVALGIVALGVLIWLTGLLALGVSLGFARIALDGGRVIQSLRFGTALVFARANRRAALVVGVPLAFIVILGNFGGNYAGIVAYGLTGSDAANVIVQTIGDVTSWSILAAVATIYYRNLTPAA